jgi:uncharacterized membrane protein YjdF
MHAAVAVLFSIAFVIIAIFAKLPTYRVSPFFLIPIMWAVYLLRRKLHLHPLHYFLFGTAMLLHDLGAFGFYQRSFFGLSFDIYVHYYFAFVGTFMVFRAFEYHMGLRAWQTALLTIMFIMGMGGIHEVIEYISTLMLGPERGMLKTNSYIFDTNRDLTNNLLGCLTALVLYGIIRAVRRPMS